MDPQSRWEVILSVAHCFSPQQRTPMGCKQSTVSGYKRLTEEDILGDSPAVSRPGESQQDPGDEVLV